MATVTRTTVWSDNQVLSAAALNGEFNNLLNALALVNADVASNAAIAYSKLNLSLSIVNADVATNAAIAVSKIATGLSGSLVGDTDTQTLTNKTLTSPTINAPTIKAAVHVVTAVAAQAFDGSTANIFTRTLAASETFTQSNFTSGQCFIVRVKQGSGTTYTVTWWSGITWVTSGGTAPVQTTTSNGITSYGFICTGANTFEGYLVGTA